MKISTWLAGRALADGITGMLIALYVADKMQNSWVRLGALGMAVVFFILCAVGLLTLQPQKEMEESWERN